MSSLDPSFRERFNWSLEEIIFKTPSHVSQVFISANACTYAEVTLFWYACDKKKPLLAAIKGSTCRIINRILNENGPVCHKLTPSVPRWMSVATCSWWLWLRMCIWSWRTLAASSDCPEVTSDAACCSCSSGCTVVEDGHLRVEASLRSLLVYSVSYFNWITIKPRYRQGFCYLKTFETSTDLQESSQFPHLDSSVAERGDNTDSRLPHCGTGCAASMLGLHLVTPNQLLHLLKASIDIST